MVLYLLRLRKSHLQNSIGKKKKKQNHEAKNVQPYETCKAHLYSRVSNSQNLLN